MALVAVGVFGSKNAIACSWPTTAFACCSSSSAFPNSPETRYLTGCAVSRADADARCLAAAAGSSNDAKMRWATTQCQSNGGSQVKWGKVCTVARRGQDSFTYYAWDSNPNASWDSVCDTAKRLARQGSSGKSSTHIWKTTFKVNGTNRVEAECMNGSFWHTGRGLDAVHEVNRKRKQGSGNGCLFKVHK